ncbi:hypothetical protein ACP275_02G188600 [Erythranthe tilingii]
MSRFAFIVVVFLLFVWKPALSVPTCKEVVADIAPCIGYLQGNEPTAQCCAGMKKLSGLVKTKKDRVASCSCGKQALSSFNYDASRLPLLPQKCGVNFNMPAIDKNFDCSKLE